MNIKSKLKNMFQKALDTTEDGVVSITNDMQSEEKVEKIRVRRPNQMSSSQTIVINGRYTFTTNNCIAINIEGDVHTVDTQGSVTCENVAGNVSTQGSVTCKNVTKNISTQGSVDCGDVGGKISTQGRVTCGDVHGNINTMGKVEANNVKGSIDTMGKVTVNSRG